MNPPPLRTSQERVHKNTKVWTLYLDLEESLGTVDTTRAAYTRALELKIATPQLVLNFAAFLEEQGYFEESFTVYEKGVAVFKWPHVKPLWHAYLDKFISRREALFFFLVFVFLACVHVFFIFRSRWSESTRQRHVHINIAPHLAFQPPFRKDVALVFFLFFFLCVCVFIS